MVRPSIDVSGIRQFARQVRQMDRELGKTVRVVLNSSAQLVVDRAGPKIPTRTGAARSSLKVRSSQREARVAAGGRRAPYYPWLDFGGSGPNNRPAPRPFYTEGRYVYPSVRENRDEITRTMSTGLADLARSAGLEVT